MATGKMAIAVVAVCVLATFARAEDRNWKDPVSGSFHLGANWLEGTAPGAGDRAFFDLSSAGYSVSFSSSVTNDALEIENDNVTFELGAFAYNVSSIAYVGRGGGSDARFTVHGTKVESFNNAYVGADAGIGQLLIEGGATWTAHNGFGIGVGNPPADGAVTLTGFGTSFELLNCCGLRIGEVSGNTGSLTIENQATATLGPGDHLVGVSGDGFLAVQSGGQLTADRLAIGCGAGATGELTVDNATVQVSHLTQISCGSPVATGVVTIAGPGASLTETVPGDTEIGAGGIGNHGTLAVSNGATCTFLGNTFVARGDVIGELTVDGPGSSVSVPVGAFFLVGTEGLTIGATGTVIVSNGALLDTSASDCRIGVSSLDSGSVTVTGVGSSMETLLLIVGERGSADLSITDGGNVQTTFNADVGAVSGSNGNVVIDGPGSTWNLNNTGLSVGSSYFHPEPFGHGTLTITNGGTLLSRGTVLGYRTGEGEVIVSGAGSSWDLGNGVLHLGNETGAGGYGLLTIDSGATVSALRSEVALSPGAGARGTVSVMGAGSSWTLALQIDLGSNGSYGILEVADGGLVVAEGIGVGTESRIRGDGVLQIVLAVSNGGTIEPGMSTGLLTIDGNFFNNPDGALGIEVGGLTFATQYDQLVVTGAANIAGRLEVDLINGFVPSAGDTFDIMTYGSVAGRFETIISDNLPAGLQWALDYNPTVLTLIACDPVADPSCDDCNLNGILDGEDIANLTSLDVDLDGIPDECANFVAACFPPTDQWSCFDNWDLPGSQYPDDVASAAGVFVTLNETDIVTLDVDATIPGLRILEEAELHATVGDLTVYGNSDTFVEGHLLAGDRNIDLSNSRLVLAPGGVYEKDPAEPDALGALTATAAYLFGNSCSDPPCPHGGEMNLDDDMEVAITGSLTLDGRLSDGPCEMFARDVNHHQAMAEGVVANQTFHTPPSIRILLDTRINIGLNLLMQGAAGFVHESTQPVTVGDDWSNQITHPECFQCRLGSVVLTGANPHDFEVAGTDVGPVGTVDGTEFVMGGLEVMDNAQVVFRDAFDNNGTGPANCGEALYVDVLTLGAGSTVILENCRVYYQTLVKDPLATVVTHGCAELMSVSLPDAPLPDPSGLNKARTISMGTPTGANTAGGGAPHAIKVTLVSLHRVVPPYTGGPSMPFDSFEGQVRWAGPPAQYVESSSNPIPFFVSSLQCSPHYQNWSTVGLLHILGTAVVPSSSYRIQFASASCQGIEDRCTALSAPLTVVTTRWGDVETPYNPPSATVQPDVTDISALVNKFRNATGAPIKARALLAGAPGNVFGEITPAVLNVDLGFSHISACVDAFRGVPYPYTIQACP